MPFYLHFRNSCQQCLTVIFTHFSRSLMLHIISFYDILIVSSLQGDHLTMWKYQLADHMLSGRNFYC